MGKSKRTKELQQRLNQNLLMRHLAGLQAVERQAELVRLGPTMPSQDNLVMPPWKADEGMTVQQWLDDQARLQAEAYGDNGLPKQGEEFAFSAMMNATALTVELGELMNELAWKPWSATRGRPHPEHRLKAVLELVDMMHFVANFFLLLEVDAEEFRNVWRHKQQVNRDRQARGYDATAPGEKRNGRATDDDPAAELAGDIAAGLDRADR